VTRSPRLTPSGYELPVFEPVIPRAVSSGVVEKRAIVIVGGGLAGLTLAADLSFRGVDAVLVDDDTTVGVRGASSRGMVYVQKTLEIMDRLGVYERIREKGVTWSIGRTLSGPDIVYEFDSTAETASLQPAFINIQQFYVEWYLADRIKELGAVELRWGNRLTRLDLGDEHPLLTIQTVGGSYQIEAQWVIDATGANSPFREGVAVAVEAAHAVDHWCICDVRFTKALPAERWTWVDAPFNDDRAVWQHKMADDVWRLDYQLGPHADPAAAADPQTAYERVRAHLGPDVEFELVWVGPWQYRTQLAQTFVKGRYVLLGDAAHVKSPFGARGGNSGIQDADNLGWKLAAVVKNLAPRSLMVTYDQERREAAAENIRVTKQTARFLAPQSEFEHRLRSAVIGLARQHVFARPWVNTGRLLTPNLYTQSSINGRRGGYCLPNVRLVSGQGIQTSLIALTREHAEQPLVLYRTSPDDLAVAVSLAQQSAPFSTNLVRLCGPDDVRDADAVADEKGELLRLTRANPGEAIIVRPDLYCADVVSLDEIVPALRRAMGMAMTATPT
jgi:3-(3-hydroxy-phenyl)propionate hydroxylase